jgi:hypothetical protein
VRAGAVEQSLSDTRHRDCCAEADGDSKTHRAQRTSNDQPNDVASLGTESDPHPHLVAALRDTVCDHTVDPDCRECKGEDTKERQHRRVEPLARDRR